MRVTNKTDLDTKELKRFFIECAKQRLDNWGKMVITVIDSKGRWIHGWACYTKPIITIKIPKKRMTKELLENRWGKDLCKLKNYYAWLNFNRHLAWIVVHEMLHTLDRRHRDMNGDYFNHWKFFCQDSSRLSFADKFILIKEEG